MGELMLASEVIKYALIKPKKKYKTVNAGKTYKVFDKDDKFLHVIFYPKIKKKEFKSNRSLLATYKANKKLYPLKYQVEMIDTDIHKFEVKRSAKEHKNEIKDEISRYKVEKEIAGYIDEKIKTVLAEEKEKREMEFKKELARLEKKGWLFLYEHQDLTLSQIAKISSKKLSTEGWHFCFEYEQSGKVLYHFQRPIQQKKVASTRKR